MAQPFVILRLIEKRELGFCWLAISEGVAHLYNSCHNGCPRPLSADFAQSASPFCGCMDYAWLRARLPLAWLPLPLVSPASSVGRPSCISLCRSRVIRAASVLRAHVRLALEIREC